MRARKAFATASWIEVSNEGLVADQLLAVRIEDMNAVAQRVLVGQKVDVLLLQPEAQQLEIGVDFLNGPIDRLWGRRTASFADPSGHVWEIAQLIERR